MASKLVPVARRLDEPFMRRGRCGEVRRAPTGDYRYRVRGGVGTSGLPRARPVPESEAAERQRLVKALDERVALMLVVGPRTVRSGRVAMWTAERITAALRDLGRSLGRTPTMADLQSRPRSRWPSPARVRIVFGSWNAAVAAADLPLNATGRARRRMWSDDEILQAIREAAVEGDHGQRPFREGRRRPWLATITVRFGSWSVAEALALGCDRSEALGHGSVPPALR